MAQSATDIELKAAWRAAQQRWHPDRCKEPQAAERFSAARDAYRVLSDPATRARYDLERVVSADAASLLARKHLGRDLTPRERTGIGWLAAAVRLAKR